MGLEKNQNTLSIPHKIKVSNPARMNINTASQSDLEQLPRIGPATAKKIIEYREQNGPFQKLEDIMKVKGIGQKIFEENKDLITL